MISLYEILLEFCLNQPEQPISWWLTVFHWSAGAAPAPARVIGTGGARGLVSAHPAHIAAYHILLSVGRLGILGTLRTHQWALRTKHIPWIQWWTLQHRNAISAAIIRLKFTTSKGHFDVEQKEKRSVPIVEHQSNDLFLWFCKIIINLVQSVLNK